LIKGTIGRSAGSFWDLSGIFLGIFDRTEVENGRFEAANSRFFYGGKKFFKKVEKIFSLW